MPVGRICSVIFFWFSFHQTAYPDFFCQDIPTWQSFRESWIYYAAGSRNFSIHQPVFCSISHPVGYGLVWLLARQGERTSTPRKIAIGMGIAALAYVVMTLGSLGLPSKEEITLRGGLPDAERVTPLLLLGTYFILTVAELFISPLGISFVSKVGPQKYQGIMQGGWLAATALGNQLLFLGALMYKNIPIWMTWSVFVGACLISMFTMLAMLKWLERITGEKQG